MLLQCQISLIFTVVAKIRSLLLISRFIYFSKIHLLETKKDRGRRGTQHQELKTQGGWRQKFSVRLIQICKSFEEVLICEDPNMSF